MKKLKKLSREHRKFLEKQGLEARDYLIERSTTEEYRFFNKKTNSIEKFKRN